MLGDLRSNALFFGPTFGGESYILSTFALFLAPRSLRLAISCIWDRFRNNFCTFTVGNLR